MSKHNLKTDNLAVLLKEKSNICISIIAPTYRISPDRRTNAAQLEKVIKQAKDQLQNKYTDAVITPLKQAIDDLFGQIDFMHNSAGIGLFVSPTIKTLIHFFFPVREKVIIGDSFEIRELIYDSFYNIPYSVLMLSQKEARLFDGLLNMLTEVTDGQFPKKNTATYEYSKPTRGSSYVGHAFVKEFEKDKSVLEEIRLKSFLHETDEFLNQYVRIETPLIITGEAKDLSYFNILTTHIKNIACQIPGNYSTYNNTELGALTWKAMKLFLDNSKEKLVRDFKEITGEGRGITDIQNIWKAVREGNCFKLLVEKDFSVPGYIINEADYELHLYPPVKPHQIIPDAVNRLIEMVLEKNGEVIMMENDALQDYNRLALITRY
jgi:hypothetical protein